MSSLLSLYFLHPFSNRLANKTQRYNPRYELTNPTKTPSPPFTFSLLSTFLLHLHYILQSPSTLFPIPFTLCYSPSFSCYPVSSSPVTTPCSFVTLSPHLLLLSPVPLLPSLLIPCYYPPFLCYPVSSSPVTIPCSIVTLSLIPLLLPLVPLLLCLPLPCLLISYRVKNVYLSYPQGPLLCPRQGLSSMQNMPFLPLEEALLACRTCPSWRHVFKSLIVRRLR